MKTEIRAVLFTLFTAAMVGCADKQQTFKGIPYAGGDVCEWAKKNLAALARRSKS
ncbi:MAG: hypothetical protein ACR2P5_03445 [Gammaproteobacteria bacterium]